MTDANDPIHERVDSIASTLLRKARSSDVEAWNRIVSYYSPIVIWWCGRGAGEKAPAVPRDEIADVAQEVFVAVWKGLQTFRRSREDDSFRGWLRTITRNKVVDYWRRHGEEPRARGGVSAESALERGVAEQQSKHGPPEEDRLLYRRVLDCVRAEFSDRDWRAFVTYRTQECTAKEVAAEYGMNVNQVHLAASRIGKRVKQVFEEFQELDQA